MFLCLRVAPILKKAIDAGEINLTAIVNTHQFVLPHTYAVSLLGSV